MSKLKRDLILSAIDVTREKRDKAISDLIKHESKLRELHKRLKRFDRSAAKQIDTSDIPETKPEFFETAKLVVPPADDGLDIPREFVRRGKEADRAAREEIERANAERKRTKSQVRVQKLLAKKSGETAKLPLTGKDALRFIREGK